jgi:hypothetical protein
MNAAMPYTVSHTMTDRHSLRGRMARATEPFHHVICSGNTNKQRGIGFSRS